MLLTNLAEPVPIAGSANVTELCGVAYAPTGVAQAAALEMLRSLPDDLTIEEADAAFLSLYEDDRAAREA